MKTTLTLEKFIEMLGGQQLPLSDQGIGVSSVVVDSREVEEGSIFVALRGETVDGHLYVQDAFDRGAVAAVVEREIPCCEQVLDLRVPPTISFDPLTYPVCLRVQDVLVALQQASAGWRSRHDVRVVGITGSIGKTTTKDLVALVLAQRHCVLKSQGNYNNEIGLPLTLLRLNAAHHYAVLEMGTYGPGEIRLLAKLARPHIGVVTNVGPVHLERMGTIERIVAAKSELPHALPADGVAILNGDDERVQSMTKGTQAQVFTYGFTSDCDLWADSVETHGLSGVRFRFHYRRPGGTEECVDARIPLLGRHSVYTALRAAAVGLVEDLTWDEILRGLRLGEQVRLAVLAGIRGSILMDDTYNSSPESATAALDALVDLEGRKIAVLGDMLELGAQEAAGHYQVGRRAADVVSLLVTVGERGRLIGAGALESGMAQERVAHMADNEQAIAYLQTEIQEGDVLLIKGSRGMSMEQIVEALVDPSVKECQGIGRR
jgi:UDP-N-acetylmuramoyl-tripeptide--D-alanyl-D-alanine ligase